MTAPWPSIKIVCVLLPARDDVLNDWLEAHGYFGAAEKLRAADARSPFDWVLLPFQDETIAAFLDDYGMPHAAQTVRREYHGQRERDIVDASMLRICWTG